MTAADRPAAARICAAAITCGDATPDRGAVSRAPAGG
jgi:hypothetical protein